MTKISTEKRERSISIFAYSSFRIRVSSFNEKYSDSVAARNCNKCVHRHGEREILALLFSWPRMNAAHVFRREIENISYDPTRPDGPARTARCLSCTLRRQGSPESSASAPFPSPLFCPLFSPFALSSSFFYPVLSCFFSPPFGLRARTSRRSCKSGDVCRV